MKKANKKTHKDVRAAAAASRTKTGIHSLIHRIWSWTWKAWRQATS